MRRILVLGQWNLVARMVIQQLSKVNEIQVVTGPRGHLRSAKNYLADLKGVNEIASFLGPMDLDLDFEALFEALHKIKPPLKQFLMMSAAGINHEVRGQLKYPGVENFKEYREEQLYAIKVVDEEEIPYTILRPVEIIKSRAVTPPRIIEEGHQVPAAQVSYQNVVKVALDVIIKREYQNQSIAILGR